MSNFIVNFMSRNTILVVLSFCLSLCCMLILYSLPSAYSDFEKEFAFPLAFLAGGGCFSPSQVFRTLSLFAT